MIRDRRTFSQRHPNPYPLLTKEQRASLEGRLADASKEGPAEPDSFPESSASSSKEDRLSAESTFEEETSRAARAKILLQELQNRFLTSESNNKTRSFLYLLSMQAEASRDASDTIRECMEEAPLKFDSTRWFLSAVINRLKDRDLWDPQICRDFNKRKWQILRSTPRGQKTNQEKR